MSNTSHVEDWRRTDSAQCNLRPSIPANDNLQPVPTTPFSEDDFAAQRLGAYPDEIVKLPSARENMIFAFALVAALVLIAWFYALSLPQTDLPPAKIASISHSRAWPSR
jgi:hypothetical protein